MHLLYIPALMFYLIAGTFCLSRLLSRTGPVSAYVIVPAVLALIFHTLWLGQDMLIGTGQDLGLLNMASLVSFIISMMMTVATVQYRVWILLPVVYGFSALILAGANLIPMHYITHLEQRPELLAHISFALLAYATLIIASLFALQHWYLDHTLKSRSVMAMHPALPPLMTIEKQLFWLIKAGVILLTMSLISGYIFLDDLFSQGKAHKAIFTLIAWLGYLILLWGHHKNGWRGRIVVIFSLTGAILLTLAYFGSRFVKEVILS